LSGLQSYIHLLILLAMAKKGDKRKIIGLISEESGERLYYTTKNTMNTPEKLSLRKYSPKLRKHVTFTETKKNLGRNEAPKR
jgi:large subunit ribosomal protein L33